MNKTFKTRPTADDGSYQAKELSGTWILAHRCSDKILIAPERTKLVAAAVQDAFSFYHRSHRFPAARL